ncbi:MAG TPA: CCA tRNA nucleotidyltransferase, partial [Nitrososphaera sp.]|nr:CCA tRNA nucleotidyltransferase [Nitrososphaera sp.]
MTDTIIQSVLEKVLALCNPTAAEEKKITAVAEEAKRLVEQSRTPEVRDVIFGGSFAKGTWLRGDADIDIFVKIDPSVSEERFEKLGVEIGSNALKKYGPKLRYSDHPYVEAIVRGTRINIVPCYDVQKGQWKSAADRSPFHTQYITETLDAARKEQVRLLKKFLKSAGIYGAEISTGGFSGYVSEVLIAKYGLLKDALAAAAEFKQGQVISVGDYDKDVAKGFSSPLVIIDPIDPRRNLGTAVSPESAGRLTLAARAFLRSPSEKFFARQKPRVNKKLYRNVLVVEFSHRERSPDTIWGQLKRSANSISKQLEIAGFTVFRTA